MKSNWVKNTLGKLPTLTTFYSFAWEMANVLLELCIVNCIICYMLLCAIKTTPLLSQLCNSTLLFKFTLINKHSLYIFKCYKTICYLLTISFDHNHNIYFNDLLNNIHRFIQSLLCVNRNLKLMYTLCFEYGY